MCEPGEVNRPCLLVAALAVACSSAPAAEPAPTEPQQTAAPTTAAPAPPTEAEPDPVEVAVTTTLASFESTVAEIDDALAASMTPTSWREGCPVELADLRVVRVRHWNDSGRVVDGELIVHRDHAEAVAGVFEVLFDAGFPIARMSLIDEYGGSDDASMADNNTSGFNCRGVAGGSGRWSEHAYGTAIDVNPLVNPYVTERGVDPPGGEAYVDRDPSVAGLIVSGDVVVEAFATIGWEWGGDWSGSKDYQHFSAGGR